MSRYKASGSRGHAISEIGWGDYRLHWVVDRYYPGSRLRHPRDLAGAIRFARMHGCLKMPTEVREAADALKGSGQNLADAHSKNPPEAEHG